MAKKDLYIISLILLVINGILIWPLITPTHYKNDKLITIMLIVKIIKKKSKKIMNIDTI